MHQPPETNKRNRAGQCSVDHPSFSRILAVSLLLYPFLWSCSPTAFAQKPESTEDVVRVTTDLLLFPIRIRDKSAKTIAEIKERDLTLSDKDHVVSALHFSAGAERIALVFALDQSGSLREIISNQQEAALALFQRFSERSRIAVVRFAESPLLVSSFGRDAEATRSAFNFPPGINRRTAIFDGASYAITTFDQLPPDRAERRIVILISDGLDNASTVKPSAVIDAGLDKHVSFYIIHLPLFEPREGHLAVRQPTKGFRDLAEKTGGKYFLVGDLDSTLSPSKTVDLSRVFQAIEEDLRSQYLIGFYLTPAARDGRRHRFSLSVPAGLEYSLGKFGYSRSHDFFVNMPPQ
jgi:VWFA-related protein